MLSLLWLNVISSLLLSSLPKNPPLYLDPGSGSYIFQLIIAALVGGAFVIKLYWKKISALFRHIFNRGTDDPEE